MADLLDIYTPDQDLQVYAGKGHVAGVMVSSTSTTSGACTLYDYAGVGPPDGPKVFEVMVCANAPVIVLFNDRYSPRFHNGLWLISSADVYVSIWHHHPTA
ncbi:MAG: hypothetical protein C3F13_18040 [Anaerolineales bacterium]|nr:hypothetical protein [Anaerolineae bacterium]PWB49739.1 MAG: hypothetical protein C3F13_18040 [Anaerolineales bacterium]